MRVCRASFRAFFLVCLLDTATSVAALRLNVVGQHGLRKRASADHVSGLTNGQNIDYSTNITLNGQPFSVLIDTGSSDLWVAGTVSGAKDTGKQASVTYAIGNAEGNVKTASLSFLNYTISDQAFIEVSPSADQKEGSGIIGLGPNKVSSVYQALGSQSAGDAPVDRIFRQNTSSPNFLSVLLGRSDDPDDRFPGELTVGEIIPGYENVTKQSKVDVSLSKNQHWQVLLDNHGFLGPDGQPINVTTNVSGTKNKTQLTAVFDTGFSLPQVPAQIADSIYGRFVGAEYKNVSGLGPVWVLPCEIEVNVTVLLGGQRFPMHPLDTNFDIGLNQEDVSGRKLCVGSLQPISTAASSTFDIVLGMSWLRNAYLVINYGNFRDGTTDRDAPYVQALATTDPAEAHEDFVQVRLNGVDSTGTQTLLDAPTTVPTPTPDNDDNDESQSWFARHWVVIAIAAASTAAGLLALALVAFCLQRRRRAKTPAAYRTLAAPAPAPAADMVHVQGYNAGRGFAPGHSAGNSSLSVPVYLPGHGRELSDSSTLLEHGYDADKYAKDDFVPQYSNPWDRTHSAQ